MKIKENEWIKDKAVLEQKCEILQIKVKESKEREDNLKKMNENIMSALNDVSYESSRPFLVKCIKFF